MPKMRLWAGSHWRPEIAMISVQSPGAIAADPGEEDRAGGALPLRACRPASIRVVTGNRIGAETTVETARVEDKRRDGMLRGVEMAARIYRASIGAAQTPVDEILASDGFRDFAGQTGRAISPLTPLFDVDFYLEHIPAPLRASINPVIHFCKYAPFSGFAPTWLFDAAFIRRGLGWPEPVSQASSTAAAPKRVAGDTVDLFVALVENVSPPFLSPHPLFDADLWAASAPRPLEIHPAADFVTTTDLGTRCFSPYFSVPLYARLRPQIRRRNVNPLKLYLGNCAAGVIDDVNPMFHSLYYRHQNRVTCSDLLSHYLVTGARAGAPPNPFADQELRITDGDRLGGGLAPLYLDYLRCDADLAGSAPA
jgi:hypothetical protein